MPTASRRGGAVAALLAVLLGWPLAAPATAAATPDEQLRALGAEQAWQQSTGDGVTVAVLDSGVDTTHPDLAGQVLPGRDFVDGSTDGRVDPVGHGTAVASLIAGSGEHAVTGLAPDATVLPVRVLDEQNRYQSASTVAQGVLWAVEQGADVINLSLGGARDSTVLSAAITVAMANDVVVVACTGNADAQAPRQVWYPGREPGVVAVAGLVGAGDGREHWPRSLFGRETVLSAPAVLRAAAVGGGTRPVQGTSFSTALVTATAALIRARWPDATAGNVVNRLVTTADDLGEAGRDELYGFGALDAAGALTAEVAPVPANPLDTRARFGQAGFGTAPDHTASPQPRVSTSPSGPVAGHPAGGEARPEAATARRQPPPWLAVVVTAGVIVLVLLTVVAASRRRRSR